MVVIGNRELRFDRKAARFSNRIISIIEAINECIQNKRLYPALILIYSCIDICGALLTSDGFATGDSFRFWVVEYLFKAKSLACNELDLWRARCGIVHTLRYDAKTAQGRDVLYGFRGYDDEISAISDPRTQVGVYIEDLFEGLRTACSKYLDDLEILPNPNIDNNLTKLPKFIDLIPIDLE